MRFKLDENLPAEMADLFNGAGHDAVTVLDGHLGGVSDPELATVSSAGLEDGLFAEGVENDLEPPAFLDKQPLRFGTLGTVPDRRMRRVGVSFIATLW